MDKIDIVKIINIDSNEITNIEQLTSLEDGSFYEVWKLVINNQDYILKKAKNREIEIYNTFFKEFSIAVPKIYNTYEFNDEKYILMEYVEGYELFKCTKEDLIKSVDALINIQSHYWDTNIDCGYSFNESLKSRINRGKYLNDSDLEKHYKIFLDIYSNIPKTLCHDDLLPFNVMIRNNKAIIIDWEHAGILPYLTSFARLIAHGGENDEFFYIKECDKEFIITYYYDNFVKDKKISYNDYLYQLKYFLLYEYCEWIMLKNKYPDGDENRYKLYYNKAKKLINLL